MRCGGEEPVLTARLALPAGEVEVVAAPGEVVLLPDDARYVDALSGAAPDGGHHIRVAGRRVERRSQAARVRSGLVTVGAGPVAPDVTVVEHLVAVLGRAAAVRRLQEAPLLGHRGGDPAGVLSGGERRVLDWVVADAVGPRVALLDRPATGLDPDSLTWAHAILDRWLDGGAAALLRVGRVEEERWIDYRADGSPRGSGAPPEPAGGVT